MTNWIGSKFVIGLYDPDKFKKCAQWCNETQLATIVKKEGYFECVEIEQHIPTEEEIQARMTDFVQSYMDNMVHTRGYDNIHTAVSYSNSTDPIFKAEGLAALEWRDRVWRTCYNLLDQIKSGERGIPTTEELIEILPKLEW